MSRAPRRRNQAELADMRRRQLAEVAIALFGRRGYHTTTIRDIAQRAGVSVGLIYQYFRDKEELLFYAITEILDSYGREIPKALATGGTAVERFHAAVHAYARVIDRNRDAAALGYRESWSLSKERLAVIFRKELETNQLIRDCVRACIDEGAFRPTDDEILTYQLVVIVHAWALSAWRLPRSLTVDEYVDRNLAVLLEPVWPDGSAARRHMPVAPPTLRPEDRKSRGLQ